MHSEFSYTILRKHRDKYRYVLDHGDTKILSYLIFLSYDKAIMVTTLLSRARLFSKSSLAQLQEFWNSSICLYEIKKKNLSKSTCPTGSFTCPGPSGSGKQQALLSVATQDSVVNGCTRGCCVDNLAEVVNTTTSCAATHCQGVIINNCQFQQKYEIWHHIVLLTLK